MNFRVKNNLINKIIISLLVKVNLQIKIYRHTKFGGLNYR